MPAKTLQRCDWPKTDLSIEYHDNEWGAPVHDDRLLFEALVLDGMQAGLSWEIVLRKRDRFREQFYDFEPSRVARMQKRTIERLMQDAGIIRNRMKIEAAVNNAKRCLEVTEAFGSFDAYLWRFVDGKPLRNRWKTLAQIPAKTTESDAMSKDLKERGFKFAGSTICYAIMQTVGMVNDHLVTCYRHRQINKLK